VVATPMKPTVKRVAGERIVETVERGDLWCAQTPQIARRPLLVEGYAAAERDGVDLSDDVQAIERLGKPVAVVPGSEFNLKVTTPEDLVLARAILDVGLAPGESGSGITS
jgi:2-C-methyl-D-erythritol 4-phosphate cytidylyltransferase